MKTILVGQLWLSVVLAVFSSEAVIAKDRPARSQDLNIVSVSTDFDLGILTIGGVNFPTDGPLEVSLDSNLLGLISVTADTIVAGLPVNFPDGDYLLTVADDKRYDEYDLTIKDTSGLQSQVQPCAEGFAMREINADGSVVCESFMTPTSVGAITIRSTSGSVRIAAGSTTVVVRQDGTVSITGNQVDVNAIGALNMSAGTNMNLSAPTIKIDAAALLTLKGGLVNIN